MASSFEIAQSRNPPTIFLNGYMNLSQERNKIWTHTDKPCRVKEVK